MKKPFLSFGSIGKFSDIIKHVRRKTTYLETIDGVDIHDITATYPTIEATASEKIHGTNGSVCFNNKLGFWVQSRKRIITPGSDNAACAMHCIVNEPEWMEIINELATENNVDLDNQIITIYFEWCGEGIQGNKSAVFGMPKMAMIFQYAKVSDLECEEEPRNQSWVSTEGKDRKDNKIYNIMNFPSKTFEINFGKTAKANNELIAHVLEEVEPVSPVGKALGFESNVGEGVVVQFMFRGELQRFKVKGEKHTKSKVKTLKPVNDVLEQKKIDFSNHAMSASRLEQAWDTVFGINNEIAEPSRKYTGAFLKAVNEDVIKEESEFLVENGLTMKDVNKMMSGTARLWLFRQIALHDGLGVDTD